MSTVLRISLTEYDRMIAKGEFDQMGKRIEMLEGVITEISPAGPIHDSLIAYLTRWSIRNTNELEISVCVQVGLTLLESDSRPEPDLFWVKAGRYMDRHPGASDTMLVIEIAGSSLEKDTNYKAELYSRSGIPEYWIVDVESESILVHRDPKDGKYTRLTRIDIEGVVSPLCCANAELNLRSLFAKE